jgi:hypothetical protein
VHRLFLVSSLILCSLIGSTIQIPHVLAFSDNQTSDNSTIKKTVQAKITLANNLNETLDSQTSPTQSSPDTTTQGHSKLPKWIKSTFIAYAQGNISEDELLNAITFLVQNNIIKIQSVFQPSTTANTSNQQIVTNSDFSKIIVNVDNYQNRLGKFSGKITNIDTQGGLTGITLQLEENSYDKLMFVILNNQDASQYVKDDCVGVEGSIKGGDRDPNAFGALLPYPKLNGQKINKISCLDALYPALKTVDLNLSQKVGNVTVTVSKVEFAEKHTRVFITVQNLNTNREVYLSDQPIVQGQSGYKSLSNAADEIGIYYKILPGITEKGYKFYNPVPQHPFTLNFEAREQFLPSKDINGTYNALDHKLTFDIPIL